MDLIGLHNGILCSREKEGAYTLCDTNIFKVICWGRQNNTTPKGVHILNLRNWIYSLMWKNGIKISHWPQNRGDYIHFLDGPKELTKVLKCRKGGQKRMSVRGLWWEKGSWTCGRWLSRHKKGAINQGMQRGLWSWKMQRNRVTMRGSWKECSLADTLLQYSGTHGDFSQNG